MLASLLTKRLIQPFWLTDKQDQEKHLLCLEVKPNNNQV